MSIIAHECDPASLDELPRIKFAGSSTVCRIGGYKSLIHDTAIVGDREVVKFGWQALDTK